MVAIYEIFRTRFGLVSAVKTTKDVKEGDEFLVHYGYKVKTGPRWYKKLFEEHKKKNPNANTNFDYVLDNLSFNNEIKTEADLKLGAQQRKKMTNLLGSTYWY